MQAQPRLTHLKIGHFEKYHNTLCLSPQILHKYCFQFLLGLTIIPRENKNNAYAKFGLINKEYYGIFQSGLSIAEASFFARFLWLDAATCRRLIVLTQLTFFVFRWKTAVWKMFITVVYTGGAAVIKVKHRRDINLKLNVYF